MKNKKLILKFIKHIFDILFFWKKFKKFKKEKVKKILVISEYLGDVVVTSSFLKNLRYNFPEVEITLQCRKEAKDVAECIPFVDKIIVVNFPFGLKFRESDGYLAILKYIIRNLNKYDVVFSLSGTIYNPILIFCGRYLVGSEGKFSFSFDFLLDKKVKRDKNKHVVERYLDLLKALNLKIYDKRLELKIDEQYYKSLKNKLNFIDFDKDFVIVCHPRGGHVYKDWPFEYWNKLNNKILKDFPDVKILYGGSKNEYNDLNKNIKFDNKNIYNIAGELSLKEYFALIDLCDLLISVDTSAVHARAAFNKYLIGLYSGNNANEWDPYTDKKTVFKDVSCDKYPCYLLQAQLMGLKPCPYGYPAPCMKNIKPDEIYKKVKEYILRNKK
ncbi:glycosyltransferase family 9 protein [Methanothermococcus sp. Ax23]|uniref:glycosyltransferase family 9 protein n=1 Tax=Methanothermococcus sp. Ax23 TaxID=3156486 RepID=UPI003B9DF2D1